MHSDHLFPAPLLKLFSSTLNNIQLAKDFQDSEKISQRTLFYQESLREFATVNETRSIAQGKFHISISSTLSIISEILYSII